MIHAPWLICSLTASGIFQMSAFAWRNTVAACSNSFKAAGIESLRAHKNIWPSKWRGEKVAGRQLLIETANIEAVAEQRIGRQCRCAAGDPVVDQRLLFGAQRAANQRHAVTHGGRVAIDFLE